MRIKGRIGWGIFVVAMLAVCAQGATFYVDGQLASDITNGTYSIANRGGGGADGNAYKTVAGGISHLAGGDVMNIRAGTYTEYSINVSLNASTMTTVQSYNSEAVVLWDPSVGAPFFNCTSSANNITFRNLTFTSQNGRVMSGWVQHSGNIWKVTYQWGHEITDLYYDTYRAQSQKKTTLASVTTDRDWFHDWYGDGKTLYIYSASGNPNTRWTSPGVKVTDTYHGAAILLNGGNTSYIVMDNCTVFNYTHCGFKGGSRPWIKNCKLYNIGNNGNDHLMYLTGNNSASAPGIVENNDLGFTYGAAVHLYSSPSYYIVRYNTMNGKGPGGIKNTWGIVNGGSYNTAYGNSIYGCSNGYMFFRTGCTFNTVKNNVFYGNTYDLAIDGTPANNTCTYNYLGSGSNNGLTGSYSTYDDPPSIVNTTCPWVSSTPAVWSDFKLSATSLCINAGTNVGDTNKWAMDPRSTTWPAGVVDQNLHGSGWEMGAFAYVKAPVGRYVFYNNSKFDGNDPAANAADDGAIATDKTALLPGGVAKFANYTSYTRGINGIMIDIASLPTGTPTAADFTFKVGNDNTPSAWPAAPAPTSITVRRGAGTGGSDRITILWADNAIQKQWLQVTVLANTHTGLTAADVSYWGNAIGDTGNSTTDAQVTPADEIVVRNNPHTLQQNPAPITDPCDFTRDGKVGPTDEIVVRNNATNASTALKLITVP